MSPRSSRQSSPWRAASTSRPLPRALRPRNSGISCVFSDAIWGRAITFPRRFFPATLKNSFERTGRSRRGGLVQSETNKFSNLLFEPAEGGEQDHLHAFARRAPDVFGVVINEERRIGIDAHCGADVCEDRGVTLALFDLV